MESVTGEEENNGDDSKIKNLNSSENWMQMPSEKIKQANKSLSAISFTDLKIIETTPTAVRANIN